MTVLVSGFGQQMHPATRAASHSILRTAPAGPVSRAAPAPVDSGIIHPEPSPVLFAVTQGTLTTVALRAGFYY